MHLVLYKLFAMDMTILIDLTTDLMIMIHKDPGVETVE